jgi:hypothetical protein
MSDDKNVAGLPLFFLLGLHFNEGKLSSFVFDEDNIARNVVTMSSELYL